MDQLAPARQASEDEAVFAATLTPYRSLSPRGFLILMTAVCLVAFVAGLAFFLMGAWPVVGFFGLDVLLIYLAFRLNYRAARLYERVDLTRRTLTVTRVPPSGDARSWRFDPYWVRLALTDRVGRASELTLSSHGRRLVIGAFLTDEERKSFAEALRGALATCKSAPA